jgi:hypothetical protein
MVRAKILCECGNEITGFMEGKMLCTACAMKTLSRSYITQQDLNQFITVSDRLWLSKQHILWDDPNEHTRKD